MSQYFKYDKTAGKYIFNGEVLEVFIPERYESNSVLHIDEFVITMGIFTMVINETVKSGFMLPALIRMDPSGIETVNTNNGKVYKLTFYNGDVFMQDEIVRNPNIAYTMFHEFIDIGNMPEFVGYKDTMFLFDIASAVTGMKFHVDHAIFEIMFAYLYRDFKNPLIQYRHSDMKNDPTLISLRQAHNVAGTTSSKIIGSFFDDAMNSALVNEADNTTELEEIMRK